MPESVSFFGWLRTQGCGPGRVLLKVLGLLVMALTTLSPPCIGAQREGASFPAASRLPPALRTPLREACAAARHATSLEEIHAARVSIDRLEERQQQATQAWLVSREDVTTPKESPSLDVVPADVLVPLDRLLETLRRHLTGAGHAGLQPGGLTPSQAANPAFAQAISDRDIGHLQRLARQTSSGQTLFEIWLMTGDLMLERGWTCAAAEAWGHARTLAEQMRDDDALTNVRHREGLRTAQSPAADATSGERRPSRSWQRRWQADLAADAHTPSSGGHPLAPITVATSHDASGGLICWHADDSVHARSLTDGRAPWQAHQDGPAGNRLFPPRGAAPSGVPAWPPQVFHGRLFTVLSEAPATRAIAAEGRRSASRLICLDVTAAAEGRLLWERPLASTRGETLVGPPAFGQGSRSEDLAVVCVRGETIDLIAIRLHDGEVLWRRPLGLQINQARAGDALPQPTFAEDLVIVADDDGSVWAINLAGEIMWVRPMHASPHPVITSSGTVAVCDASAHDLIGLDLRTGSRRWQFRSSSPIGWVGCEQDLVVAQSSDGFVTLHAVDGSVVASRSIAEASSFGKALLVAGDLFWPMRSPPSNAVPTVRILNPSTLEACETPILLEDHGSRGIALAANDGWLVAYDGTSLQVFSSPPPSNP